MCIYPGPGTQVVFTGVGGYDTENADANAALIVGKTYIVDIEGTDVGDWSTSVKLRGVNGRFNTVMFSRSTAT